MKNDSPVNTGRVEEGKARRDKREAEMEEENLGF